MCGAAHQDVLAEDRAGGGDGDVALSEMQHVGADGVGDVRPVVHGEQLAVPAAGVGEDLEVFELLGRLHALVTQLHDVDPGGEHGVEKAGEVALLLPGVRAQIEPGVGQQLTSRGHGCSPRWVGGVRAGAARPLPAHRVVLSFRRPERREPDAQDSGSQVRRRAPGPGASPPCRDSR